MSLWQLIHGDTPPTCGGGGGRLWQLPHAAWLPSTRVHVGAVFVPPEGSPYSVTAPWQLVDWQVPASYTGFAPCASATPENVISAGAGVSRCPESSTLRGTLALVARDGARTNGSENMRLVGADAGDRGLRIST